uniref:Uncharacterized protein n=1 Tax=Ditylenchus dipsaci TaxID=166011 RepID=A0A915ET30_9BILA
MTLNVLSGGHGHIWRFPSLVYEHNGGAFLIPYFACSFIIGFPMLYLELSLGQFTRMGPAVVYGWIRPYAQGIGWVMVSMSLLVCIYYNMIVAWTLFYLFKIITGGTYQWSSCVNEFNTPYCSSSWKICVVPINFMCILIQLMTTLVKTLRLLFSSTAPVI